MQIIEKAFEPRGRREFLRMTASLATMVLIAGCGGGGAGENAAAAPATPLGGTPTGASTGAVEVSEEASNLNLALNLEYLGAQFYAYASAGSGLAAELIGGIGQQGSVSGGRRAAFTDPLISQQASELAADKLAHVIALRTQLAASAAAQPMIDLSSSANSAFSSAARAAGIVPAGATFDAFSSDENFLMGAFFLENAVAATYRTLASAMVEPGPAVTDNLSGAIYHGGVIRSMLAEKAVSNPALKLSFASAGAYLAKLDGSDTGDQTLATAAGESSNILDSDGYPIPFTRGPDQVLKTVYLTSTTAKSGGFLPNGANGLRA